jgi:hypothetical protein
LRFYGKTEHRDLIRIERLKTLFMEKILRIGKKSPSFLVYEFMREIYFIEYIRLQH